MSLTLQWNRESRLLMLNCAAPAFAFGPAGLHRPSKLSSDRIAFTPEADSRFAPAAVGTQWERPDMHIISPACGAVPQLPSAMFGDTIWAEIDNHATNMSAPADYVAAGYLGAAAGAIGLSRKIMPLSSSKWTEPSILWIAAVGDPSVRKTPALGVASNALKDLEAHYHSNRETKQHCVAEHPDEALTMDVSSPFSSTTDSIPPQIVMPDFGPPPFVVNDTTKAALAEICSMTHRLVQFRDELTGWLSRIDKPGSDERAFWLEACNGRTYAVHRKTGGSLHIPGFAVSVLGGLQPEMVERVVKGVANDGLAARFLWFWPEKRPYEAPTAEVGGTGLFDALHLLSSLQPKAVSERKVTSHVLTLTPDAEKRFSAFYKKLDHWDPKGDAILHGFIGKLPGMTARLLLVTTLLRWAYEHPNSPVPQSIGIEQLEAVISFVEQYAIPMFQRTFGARRVTSPLPETILAQLILDERPEYIKPRDLLRRGLKGLNEAGIIERAVTSLVAAHWLMPAPDREGPTTGRKSNRFAVNPKLWEMLTSP